MLDRSNVSGVSPRLIDHRVAQKPAEHGSKKRTSCGRREPTLSLPKLGTSETTSGTPKQSSTNLSDAVQGLATRYERQKNGEQRNS